MIESVLATDMAKHFETLSRFATRGTAPISQLATKEMKRIHQSSCGLDASSNLVEHLSSL